MTESIIKITASVLGWFMIHFTDAFIGKWVAYVKIAWDIAATKAAIAAYEKAVLEFKNASSDKFKQWEDWRKKAKEKLSNDTSKTL